MESDPRSLPRFRNRLPREVVGRYLWGMPSVQISVAVGKGFSRLARRGLLSRLDEVEGLRVVDGSESATPDVLIVGNLDSIDEPTGSAPVVIVFEELSTQAYVDAYAAGAAGAVHSEQAPEAILRVIESAMNGEVILPRQVALETFQLQPPTHLTDTEVALLQALSNGASVTAYAEEVFLSERSARRMLQAICLKLGVGGRAAAIKLAAQRGIIV